MGKMAEASNSRRGGKGDRQREHDDYSLFKEKVMARIPKISTPSGNIPL